MSMRLTPENLSEIAGKVRDLEKVGGIKIRQVEVAGHLVFLDQVNDRYNIVGITDKIGPNTQHVTRGRGITPAEEYDVPPSRHTIGKR